MTSGGGRISRSIDIAVVGAGPYGLSVAAHVAARGADVRVFGPPLDTWRNHMPRGMQLKSDGFASSLSTPAPGGTLGDYCETHGLPYDDLSIPVPLATFNDYALDFQRRFAPDLDTRMVAGLDRTEDGFALRLDDDAVVNARRVVLAVGISHFANLPPALAALPDGLASHSGDHADFARFKGRDITVLGAGSSAVEVAVHLAEAGARVRLVARVGHIRFGSPPSATPAGRWSRLRHPQSGLGPGLRSRFFSDAPDLVRLAPAKLRLEILRRHLGPSSPWRLRAGFETNVQAMLGQTLVDATPRGKGLCLSLKSVEGVASEVETDQVIAATGYRADLRRLMFIAERLRAGVRSVGGTPVLSANFESSQSGLYFVGAAAAGSFGPLMRFMFGADFAARRLGKHLVPSRA